MLVLYNWKSDYSDWFMHVFVCNFCIVTFTQQHSNKNTIKSKSRPILYLFYDDRGSTLSMCTLRKVFRRTEKHTLVGMTMIIENIGHGWENFLKFWRRWLLLHLDSYQATTGWFWKWKPDASHHVEAPKWTQPTFGPMSRWNFLNEMIKSFSSAANTFD